MPCLFFGTTGRPKGILRPLPEQAHRSACQSMIFSRKLWRFREGQVYLSPAPLYHAAPHIGVNLTIRMGGTAIIMEHLDAAQYLRLIEQYPCRLTPSLCRQCSRDLLKLPADQRRCDRSSLEVAIHAAARAPLDEAADDRLVGTKHLRVLWHDRGDGDYRLRQRGVAGTQGTVGRSLFGELHILDENLNRSATRHDRDSVVQIGLSVRILQRQGADQPKHSRPTGAMGTVGDVGYVDADGYLYLTIAPRYDISGGVNIIRKNAKIC